MHCSVRFGNGLFRTFVRRLTISHFGSLPTNLRFISCEICGTKEVFDIKKELALNDCFYTCDCANIASNVRENLFLVRDRYQGIHIVLKRITDSSKSNGDVQHFSIQHFVKDSAHKWKVSGCTAIWLHVPIELSDCIPAMVIHGFRFHHADGDYSSLCLWLDENTETRIPIAASHQVGVGGCCVEVENNKMLLVKESRKNPKNPWKIPGGFSKLGEDFGDTAKREVFEETGIRTSFLSVLGFQQKHNFPGAFGKSDFYVVVRLKPLDHIITPCPREIEDCTWMDLDELQDRNDISPITVQVVKIIQNEMSDESTLHPTTIMSGRRRPLYHPRFPLPL